VHATTDAMAEDPAFLPVAGVRLAAAAAGIRYEGRDDLALIELAPGSRVAAVFTRNAFRAAPVEVAARHLRAGAPRWLLVNAGNANAGTGRAGVAAAEACCRALAARVGAEPERVLPFSTGVIGEPLPVGRIEAALPRLLEDLRPDGWEAAARAIMTTDTVPKLASRRIALAGGEAVVTGMAKGAGMIRPDMATMLAFVATDAGVEAAVLDAMLRRAVARSFNRITVDGDTSTNDACVLMATGQGPEAARARDREALERAVTEVCEALARAIVRDGEGATRLVTVEVAGGRSEAECLQVAWTVAESPLVKTALHAADPNWGRILAAVGRAGVEGLDVEGVRILVGDVVVAEGGARAAGYDEAAAARAMERPEVRLRIELGRGGAAARVWTCDLSCEYVRINAEYRT